VTNYISYSLFGSGDVYLDGAIKNIQNNSVLMPGWVSVFYVSESLYSKNEDKFKKLYCKIVKVKSHENQISTIWRFFATDLVDAELILFRDCDSLITRREIVLINQWINSNHALHIIRDHPLHTNSIMAGLCGVRKNRIQNLLESFLNTKLIDQYGIDQWFIHKQLYKKHKGDWLIHDAFYRRESTTQLPPTPPNPNNFIGRRVIDHSDSQEYNQEFDKIFLKTGISSSKFIINSLQLCKNVRTTIYFDIKTILIGRKIRVEMKLID
jgi:hypothetical protein